MDVTGILNQIIYEAHEINTNVADRIILKQEELTLSDVTAAPFPFTGINSSDVKAVEIRVRKTGGPTDTTHIARFTMASGDTATATHGMYLGDGDLYTVVGNANCINFNIIATEALAHVCNIIYYGSAL